MRWLAVLMTHAIHIMTAVAEETTCDKDTDGCDSLSDMDWETDQVDRQVKAWVAQHKGGKKLTFCPDEADKEAVTDTAVPLLAVGRYIAASCTLLALSVCLMS